MSLEKFLSLYPPAVKDLILLGRDYLFEHVPGIKEELDLPSKILIYRIADGMKGIVFTLIPSKYGVKLGFCRGRELDDPACLMGGNGKVHTTLSLSASLFSNPDFHTLVDQAAANTRRRVSPGR